MKEFEPQDICWIIVKKEETNLILCKECNGYQVVKTVDGEQKFCKHCSTGGYQAITTKFFKNYKCIILAILNLSSKRYVCSLIDNNETIITTKNFLFESEKDAINECERLNKEVK